MNDTQTPGLAGWLEKISQVHPGSMALGLDRVGAVYQQMGAPAPAPVTIVVGGTNGKGSSVAMLSALLQAVGLRVGKSTSPHLFVFNERVQVDDRPLSDSELVTAFEAVDAARGEVLLTYFEYATLAAIWHFSQAAVDVAVLEVGLGGRLDAVNIVPAQAALITSISRDHTRWLGDTLAEIALEKAGVFKPGQIAVSAQVDAPDQLSQAAASVGAHFFAAGRDYQVEINDGDWRWSCKDRQLDRLALPGLAGEHQVANAAGCLMVLQQLGLLTHDVGLVNRALGEIRLKGRLWRVSKHPEVVLDVAHNEAGAAVLARWLRGRRGDAKDADRARNTNGGRVIAVLGMLKEKEPGAFVAQLREVVDHWLLATLPPPRGLTAEQLASQAFAGATMPGFDSIARAVDAALAQASRGDRIVVTGSFITVMQAADHLGVSDHPPGAARRSEFSDQAPAFVAGSGAEADIANT